MTLAQRMHICADRAGNATRLAEKSGVSRRAIGQYLADKAEPTTSRLVAIAQAADVSVEWLATGEGEMAPGRRPVPQHGSAAPLDEELMARLVDGIQAVYREEGGRLPPMELGRLIARFQADLVAAYDDPDERRIGLKVILQKLRTDLRAHPADDQGKRLA